MSFATLAIVSSVLTSIECAVREGRKVDAGILGSFNAGISHLLLSGREPSATEVSALQQLGASVVDEDALEPETTGSEAEPPAVDPEPAAGKAPESADAVIIPAASAEPTDG